MSESISPVQQQVLDGPLLCQKDSVFTVFPSLPAELRTKIWEFALQNPDIVELQLERTLTHSLWTTATPVSSFVHVMLANYEAHNVAINSGYKATPIWTTLRDTTETRISSRLWINDNNTVLYLPARVYSQLNYIRYSRSKNQPPPAPDSHHISKLTVEFNSNQSRENIHWLSEFTDHFQRREMASYLAGLWLWAVPRLKELDVVIDCRDYRFSGATETVPMSEIAFQDTTAESGRERILYLLTVLPPNIRTYWMRAGHARNGAELPPLLTVTPSILVNGSTEEERERCVRFFRRSCRFVILSPNLPLRQSCKWTRCEYEGEQSTWDDDFSLGDHAPVENVSRTYGCLHAPPSDGTAAHGSNEQ